MIKRPAIFSISGVVLLLFGMLGMWLSARIGDTRLERTILMVVMWVLGLIAAGLIYIWLAAKAKAAPVAAAAADEIGNIMNAAKARLVTAKGKAAAQFGRLPLILVTGPTGAAKTTVITRSGVEAELLSGEVYRGETVLPTSEINVWFAHNNLIVEAGGGVTDDEARWRRLLRLVQPSRAAAVLSRGKQAPRVAIVCMPCDEFMKPAAGQSVAALAQKLRQRLADAAQELGIRLPVYVIFTKLDRVKYFEDYFRSHTRAETAEVLGATLPIQPLGNPGAFAEREARRLGEAFHTLFRGLALRRTELLPRERDDVVKAGTYEFPREFRKITDLAAQFLIDLCRPSQLGAGPFLRGFYFTGVRAVFKQDSAAAPPPLQAHAGPSALDATSVFDPRMLQAQAPAYQAAAGTRKVPEWVFLDRIFRDLVLKDAVAQGVTAGGSKVTLWQRALLAAAIAAILIVSTFMTVSFFGNRSLLARTSEAAEAARGLAVVGPVPDRDALQRLENLRVQANDLDRYSREGEPGRLGWGLYAGNRVQPAVRRFYFQRFGDLLWTPTHAALKGTLAGLPTEPLENSNYDDTYDGLKAYLVTTTAFPDSARADFLAPVLSRYWSLNLAVDSVQRRLADSQFVFFANELPHGHPLPQPADTALVERTRVFLREFGNDEQLFGYLLAIARDSVQPYRWTHPLVRNDFVVKAEFTKSGWQRAQIALNDVQRLFARESWVVGETGTISPVERSRLEQELRKRYADAYVNAWIDFLKAGRVTGLTTVADAAVNLKALSNNASPLIRMIGAASDQTAGLDSVNVGVPFKPAHVVAAPNATGLTPLSGKYVQNLGVYQLAVEQIAGASGAVRDAAVISANTNVQQVRQAIGELNVSFDPKGRATEVADAVRRLLEAPLEITGGAIGRVSGEELNKVGRDFCRQFEGLVGKFPFNRNSTTEATIEDVARVFAPNTGTLWSFYEQNLQNLISKTGTVINRPGATVQVNQPFATQFANLARISEAFFEEGSPEPVVQFTLRMNPTAAVPVISVSMGRTARYTQNNPAGQFLDWGGASTEAKIDAQVGNANATYVTIPPSPWSVFRLFYAAEFTRTNQAGTYQLSWRGPGSGQPPITGQLSFEERIPIFDPTFLAVVRNCNSQIVR